MSRSTSSCGQRSSRFPRVSGDEPLYIELWAAVFTFSPRERG